MDNITRLETTCAPVALRQRRLPTPPTTHPSESPEILRPTLIDTVDGRQLSKVHPHLVHPVPIPVPVSPALQALTSLSEISLTSALDTATSSSDDSDQPCESCPDNRRPCGCQDFRGRSPTINYPTLRSVVAGRSHRDDRSSNHSMTSLQLSNTDIRTQPTPLRRQVSLRAGARLFESQSSLVRLYIATPSAPTQEEHKRQPVPASNDTETDSSVSDDVASDDDKMSDRVPSFSDYRRHRSRMQRRESLPAWTTSNALTSSASLSVLLSNPSDIHGRVPSREHGHLNGRPNITRHRPSLILEKPTLYNHQAMAQSDIHVNRTGLEERAMKSDMDLTRCDPWDGGRPFESQLKPAKRQSVVGSFLSSISTAMSSIGSRNSSKSKAPTASNSSINRDSPSIFSRTPSIQHPTKPGKRKPFYGLQNSTADLQSGASYRDLRASYPNPMSNSAMSKSTPTLTSYATPTRSQSCIFQPAGRCTCSRIDPYALCLLHKALPSLPANKEIEVKRAKPVRLSAISTTSFKSFVSTAKRSRPQLPSAMIQANNPPSLAADRTLGPTGEHGSSALTVRKDAFNGAESLPSPIVQRAIERHAGRSLLTQANDSLRGIRGLGALTKDHEIRNHSVHNFGRKSPLLRTRHPIYRHALSVSSPCLSNEYAQDPSKIMFPSKPGTRSLRSTVASNVQAQVSVINVRAEIIPPAAPFTQNNQPAHTNLDSRQLNVSLGFNFSGTNSRDAQEMSSAWAQETTDSMGTSVGSTTPFEKEKIPFFEPFQAEAQQPSYVSFHFDLSHLETQEVDSSAVEPAQSDTNVNGESSSSSSNSRNSGNGDNDTGRPDSEAIDYISSKNLAPDHDTSQVRSSTPSPLEIFAIMDLHASTPSTPVPCAPSKKRPLEAKGDDPLQDHSRPLGGSTAEPNHAPPTCSMFTSARPLVIKDGRVVPKKKGRPPPPPRRPPYERLEYEQDTSDTTDSVAEQFQSLQEHLRKQESLAAAGSRIHQHRQQLLRDWNKTSQHIQHHKSTPCLPVSASLQEHSTSAITTAATTTATNSSSLLKDSKASKSRWSWLWWGGRKQKP